VKTHLTENIFWSWFCHAVLQIFIPTEIGFTIACIQK
jgi:hypothetical protein